MSEAPVSGLERIASLEARIGRLEDRLAAYDRGAYEHRVSALERVAADMKTELGQILEIVRKIELQESQREIALLRDILRVALAGGAGGGAVGTGVYAVLQVLGGGG